MIQYDTDDGDEGDDTINFLEILHHPQQHFASLWAPSNYP